MHWYPCCMLNVVSAKLLKIGLANPWGYLCLFWVYFDHSILLIGHAKLFIRSVTMQWLLAQPTLLEPRSACAAMAIKACWCGAWQRGLTVELALVSLPVFRSKLLSVAASLSLPLSICLCLCLKSRGFCSFLSSISYHHSRALPCQQSRRGHRIWLHM